jgi:membrane protease YdiL (CAAX protease family)
MQEKPPNRQGFAIAAAAFEGGMAIVALVLGRLFDIRPMETFSWSWTGFGLGLLGTLPMLGLLIVFAKLPWGPFRRIVRIMNRDFLPFFRECGLAEIAIIALLAGIGEEMLFRSIIQGGLADLLSSHPILGPILGLSVASLIFGLLHRITPTYAILAFAISLYLGGLWLLTGNLLVPITIHALYDFIAIIVLLKQQPMQENALEEKTE